MYFVNEHGYIGDEFGSLSSAIEDAKELSINSPYSTLSITDINDNILIIFINGESYTKAEV